MKSFVRSGSAELCVEDTGGDAAPLVCLHAGVTDRRLWTPQIDALRATHRVVAYDRRGFGQTRLPPAGAREAYSQVGDLLAVLDTLLIELDAQFWLDGPEQPTGRVVGALRELFLAMNAIPLASGSPGDEIAAPSAWERLEEIQVPTLVVWGTLDFAPLGKRMREIVQRIPQVASVVMDGVAHLPGLEKPAEFNRALLAFLASLPPAAAAP